MPFCLSACLVWGPWAVFTAGEGARRPVLLVVLGETLAGGGSQQWALGSRTPWAACRAAPRLPSLSRCRACPPPGDLSAALRSWAQRWRHCIDLTVGLITNS